MVARPKCLRDAWPTDPLGKVFLALEDKKTEALSWVHKGLATQAAALLDRLEDAPILNRVDAGRVTYIYMDSKVYEFYNSHPVDKGVQLSLLGRM